MYALLGVAIAIATVVVVYNVNGYSIDQKTGEVIQNGLIYLDTKPESAEVYLNGEKQKGRTDARLVVPEGPYSIELRRDGYLPWTRELVLAGGSLRRLTYARLIPEKIDIESVVNLPSAPGMLTQSVDKRWLVASFPASPLLMQVFDTERPQAPLVSLQLPVDFLRTKEAGTWEVIDWADDHKTFLASYRTASSVEFALINREDGTKAVNLSTLFASTPFDSAYLRGRKNDQVYLSNTADGSVLSANVLTGAVETALSDVVTYKPYGDNAFVYITAKDAKAGKVRAILRDGEQEYTLRELDIAERYLLDISKLGNAFVVGVSSPAENRAVIFNDPINALKQNDVSKIPVATTVLRVTNPQQLRISADSSVIMAVGTDVIATHEFDADRSYSFALSAPLKLETQMHWIDGQHVIYTTDKDSFQMFDFDGSNSHELATNIGTTLGFFDKDTEELYTVQKPLSEGAPYTLNRSFMRSAADRQ